MSSRHGLQPQRGALAFSQAHRIAKPSGVGGAGNDVACQQPSGSGVQPLVRRTWAATRPAPAGRSLTGGQAPLPQANAGAPWFVLSSRQTRSGVPPHCGREAQARSALESRSVAKGKFQIRGNASSSVKTRPPARDQGWFGRFLNAQMHSIEEANVVLENTRNGGVIGESFWSIFLDDLG